MHSKIDILNLEWSAIGRDRAIVTPLLLGLEKEFSYTYICDSIFRGKFLIDKYRPRILLMANSIGGKVNVEIAKYAKSKGCSVIVSLGEGNIQEEYLEQMVWGWNLKHESLEDLVLYWSNRSLDLAVTRYPELADRSAVSGAIGFDQYKIRKFLSKKDFLYRYKKLGYQHVVGYAGWCFDGLFHQQKRAELLRLDGELAVEAYTKDYEWLKPCLESIVLEHQDILFVFKEHPGTRISEKTEFHGLDRFPNVIIVPAREKIGLGDIINPCDLWLSFISTTSIEAWLLEKPTIALIHHSTGFATSGVLDGNVILNSFAALSDLLTHFKESGIVPNSEQMRSKKNLVIENIIGWDDGMNHLRAAQLVHKFARDKKVSWVSSSLIERLNNRFSALVFNLSGILAWVSKRFVFLKKHLYSFDKQLLDTHIKNYKNDIEIFYQTLEIKGGFDPP